MENRNIKKTAIEPQVHHTLNDEEQQVLLFLQDTIRHTVEPYETGLHWEPDVFLPNNYFAALSQLRSLEKSLKGKPETIQKFHSTIESDLQKNYIAPVIMTHQPPEHIWTFQPIPSKTPTIQEKSFALPTQHRCSKERPQMTKPSPDQTCSQTSLS